VRDRAVRAILFASQPGRSVVASESSGARWFLPAARKPVVVSMGDVAGSGGYYVLRQDKIVVEPANLTG
jgi:protease-4